MSHSVCESWRLVGEVERSRLEDGAGEMRRRRGGDKKRLDELGARALSSERDMTRVTSKRSDVGVDVVL